MKGRSRQQIVRFATVAAAALLTPSTAAAHPGHGQGDHGWLMGALQPFLSVDHLMAGAFVLGVGALGMIVLGRNHAAARVERDER